MVSFKLRDVEGEEFARISRPLWAKVLFRHRRMYKCLDSGRLLLVNPRAVGEAEMRARQARAHQFELQPSHTRAI